MRQDAEQVLRQHGLSSEREKGSTRVGLAVARANPELVSKLSNTEYGYKRHYQHLMRLTLDGSGQRPESVRMRFTGHPVSAVLIPWEFCDLEAGSKIVLDLED